MKMNCNLIWSTVLALLPVLSFTRFTAIDIAVNLVSVTAVYILGRDMTKLSDFVKLVTGIWAVMFAQVLVINDWNLPVKVVVIDTILSVLPIVSGGLIVSVLVVVGRKFVPPDIFEKIGGMKILLIPPIAIFLILYFII